MTGNFPTLVENVHLQISEVQQALNRIKVKPYLGETATSKNKQKKS